MGSKRPASSMDDHLDAGGIGADGKRKGMNPRSAMFSHPHGLHGIPPLRNPKLRGSKSSHALWTLQEKSTLREVSVGAALSKLHQDDSEAGSEPTLSQALLYSSSTSSGSYVAGHINMRNSRPASRSDALVLFQEPHGSLVAPNTPSQIPVRTRAEASLATPATSSRITKPSPCKTPFLSKDSNITNFTAWDVRGRLEDMEAMYSTLKDTVTGSTIERNGLEEAVSKYKLRCESPYIGSIVPVLRC